MKSTTPHDPLDELIVAALHGDLTPEERTAFETRLQNDPAARAAYQETQLMHDLLEKTHRNAQPDPAFEQRMISGVRRKLQHETAHRESAWESVLVLWKMVRQIFGNRWMVRSGYACTVLLVVMLGVRSYMQQHFKLIEGLSELSDQQEEATLIATKEPKASLSGANTYNGGRSVSAGNFNVTSASTPAPYASSSSSIAYSGGMPDAPTAGSAFAPMAPPPPGNVPEAMKEQNSYTASDTRVDTVLRDTKAKQTTGKAPFFAATAAPVSPAPAPATPDLARKLIRNAQLDLEVKSYQSTVDRITAMTQAAGGYVDTSNSQRGGNGKLQGTVVVKVLPQNLDAFLLKLRDLGDVQNQSVSTDDVTKDYYDTQARLDNSRRMETQLQDLLKHTNGKVSELLQVERELGRVRGEIEQMQGELKLYDFQVQYATVTINVHEKDLHQAAAFLLKERDEFSLFSNDVAATFQNVKQAADDSQAHIITANLNHNSGADVSAMLLVSVPPEQIETFLAKIQAMGRVENFTRQTDRVAHDGGETDQPADETLTQKDRVLVHLSIRSDNDSHKQAALTIVTSAVETAFEKAKAAALASPGAAVLASSLIKTPEGQTNAQVSVRVTGKNYSALLDAFRALGRTSSFSLQREDNSGPNAAGDDVPVVISLALTDDEAPLQQTDLSILSTDIDAKARQLKKAAAAAGVEVKASSFERRPDGVETAQMTFRLPLSGYATFLEKLKNLGRVETLSVNRQDQPDQTRSDDSAPAEIRLQLHNQGQIVSDDNGLWATLRRTFGDGAAALFESVRIIGVAAAFFAPWLLLIGVFAWVGRRIYVRRK